MSSVLHTGPGPSFTVEGNTLIIHYENLLQQNDSPLEELLDNFKAGVSDGRVVYSEKPYSFKTSWEKQNLTISECSLSTKHLLLALGFCMEDVFGC